MNFPNRLLCLLPVLLGASISSHAQNAPKPEILASSHFDDPDFGADGWQGRNSKGGGERLGYRKGGSSATTGGYIFMIEHHGDGALMFFSAPSKYLGDKQAAYNGTLAFRLQQSTPSDDMGLYGDFVVLGSKDLLLYFGLRGRPPSEKYGEYEVSLNEEAGWLNRQANRPATREEFQSVLKRLDRLWILAEYSGQSSDWANLDDVRLLAGAPGSVPLLAAKATYTGTNPDLKQAEAKYVERQEVIVFEAEAQREELLGGFNKRLGALEEAEQKKGNLPLVMTIRETRKRVLEQRTPDAAKALSSANPLLATATSEFSSQWNRLTLGHLRRQLDLASKFDMYLRNRSLALTKDGKITEAAEFSRQAELLDPDLKHLQNGAGPVAKANPNMDTLQPRSVWIGDELSPDLTFTITERRGDQFKARFQVGAGITRDVQGTFKDKKLRWYAKDVRAVLGSVGGDNIGLVNGDRIDMSWTSSGGESGSFTLRRKPSP